MLKLARIVALLVFIHPASANSLEHKLDALIGAFPHASIGVVIEEAGNRVIYRKNAALLLSPASNTKLFTAAAAILQLTPQYRFPTTLFLDDNNTIYLQFSGAPDLKTTDLRKLIAKLRSLGMQQISGDFMLDNTHFKPPYYAAGIAYDDLGWYFEAPSTSVVLDENKETFTILSAALSQKIQIQAKDNQHPLTLVNAVNTVTPEEAKYCSLNIQRQNNNQLFLYGCLSQNNNPQQMEFAVTNPTLYAMNQVKQALAQEHIFLKGSLKLGKVPPAAKSIARINSKPLSKLVKHMLLESDNLYADVLTKTLGFEMTGQATYRAGVFAIKKILNEHFHMQPDQLALADGQGTRYNLATAQQLVDFLQQIYANPSLRSYFLASLPAMGVSGTLKDRSKKSPLTNHVFAKTGTMHDISALSGFLKAKNGKIFIFSIIINGLNGNLLAAKQLEEDLLLAVLAEA